MTLLQTVQVLVLVAMMSAGQVLFKLAADRPERNLLSLATNPFLIVGVGIYGLATLLWVIVLREVPLSRAYPLTSLSMVIVPVVGVFAFREPGSWSLLAGGALMLAGAFIIVQR